MSTLVSTLKLRIFDGTRQLFSAPAKFLVTITDGNQTQRIRQYFDDNEINFDLPFFDNMGDNYTVLVYADGYQQAGFVPVTLSNRSVAEIDIMLVPSDPSFNFANAGYDTVSQLYPFLASVDAGGVSGLDRYTSIEDQSKVRACLLNLCEAMRQIKLPAGTTPLDYIKVLRWDLHFTPAQDRFFAYCDRALIDQIKSAPKDQFAVELNPGLFHPGASLSWKQIEFGEANVQLTFHEGAADSSMIHGVDCCTVEPDIDYFRDIAAHGILEVVPNAVTHSLSEPSQVYVLRWIAGQTAGIPEFAPLYTLT